MKFTEPIIDKFRVLIVVTNPEDILQEQFDFIYNYASINCMSIEHIIMNCLTDLSEKFNTCITTYNFIYFIGHGDDKGTVIGNDTNYYLWSDIVDILNNTSCLDRQSLLFLHSCYSYNASEYILNICKKVKYIICFKEPSHNVQGYTSFFMFVYYIVYKGKTFKQAVKIINKTAYEDLHFLGK
ncbi:hypothetical protein [Flavobacterium geliluteum]|uniref:Uncharacterized protein n=1 Tax=Flavobacterium geliluteum TaxID=2816120 RepID=A0A940X8V4_9FLAO|nr:hypothetical protein [Flavobacterium geliluteum]MBP4138690.1 hypothetical protein [Flavobacterium geliluteum]